MMTVVLVSQCRGFVFYHFGKGNYLIRLIMIASGCNLYKGRELALDYAKSRLSYPPKLVDKVMDYLRIQQADPSQQKFNRMLDVGCGSGQATRLFAPYFEAILGIDISEDQIMVGRKTTKEPNILYEIGNGNKFPVQDEMLDFVNCATAVHWMDITKFISECERVLKPGGCAAMYVYNITALRTPGSEPPLESEEWEPDWLKLWREWMSAIRADPLNELWIQGYHSVFEKIQNTSKSWLKGTFCEVELNWDQLRKLFASKGEYHKIMQGNRPVHDPLDDFMRKLKKYLDVENMSENEIQVIITIHYPTIVFTKAKL